MTLNENIISSYELKVEKERYEKQIEELKSKIADLDSRIEEYNNNILNELKSNDTKEVNFDGLFANLFSRENIGYTSDADVIKYLKENGYNRFVKVKTTESLDKTPLKKEIKTNESLAKALECMTVKTLTEYVVVTNEENHTKMLEHINEGK